MPELLLLLFGLLIGNLIRQRSLSENFRQAAEEEGEGDPDPPHLLLSRLYPSSRTPLELALRMCSKHHTRTWFGSGLVHHTRGYNMFEDLITFLCGTIFTHQILYNRRRRRRNQDEQGKTLSFSPYHVFLPSSLAYTNQASSY